MSEVQIILEEAFWEEYEPIVKGDGNTTFEHGETLEYPEDQVWSLVDAQEGDGVRALPGYHVVNVFAYAVTRIPWPNEDLEAVWMAREDDMFNDEEYDYEEA